MADDEDAIYIDVIPRVDDSAADSAVSKLKDKFKDVAADIGPEFMDAMNNSGVLDDLGTKLGEALSGPLKDLSEGTGLDLKNPLEKMLKQDMGGALDDIAGQLGEKLGNAIKDPLRGVASDIGVDLDEAVSKALNKDWGGLAGTLGKGVGGKLGEALGLEDTLNGLEGILSKSQDIGNVFNAFKGGNLAGGLQGAGALFGGGSSPAGGPLGDVSTFFGNVSALGDAMGHQGLSNAGSILAGGSTLLNNFIAPDAPDRSLGDSLGEILTHAGLGAGVGAGVGNVFDVTGIPEIIGALVGGGGSLLHNWDSISHNLFGGAPVDRTQRDPTEHAQYAAMFGSAPTSFDATAGSNAGTSSLYSGDTGSPFLGGGSGTTTANEVDVQASAASITAGSVTLGGSISIPGLGGSGGGGGGHATSTGVAAAGADSGSMASLYSGGGGMTIGKGHSTGGILPGDSPGHDNMIGVLPSGSMVSLEGGEGVIRPEAMGRPGVADLISSLNQHYDEGTGGGGVGGGSGGDPNNTTLSTPPTQANNAGGSGTQQDQLGKGQGGGVTGGGAIGMAEQAAVMAATVGGFGAGGIAAQMGVQETNLAIQKTSQMAAALATAPFETLGLGGGMMGAPKVNVMGGWIGKLIAGELGQQTSLPNLASSVQAPKKPDQKPDDDQQPQGETPTGPSGDKDDPMHVKVTNPQQPPQGSATSAMSTLPAMTTAP